MKKIDLARELAKRMKDINPSVSVERLAMVLCKGMTVSELLLALSRKEM